MAETSGRTALSAALLLVAIAAAGCDKEVKLTFLNTTAQSRDVELTAPGHGTMLLGPVAPTGGKLTYELKIDRDYLPAICSWEAGDRSGRFTITKQSKEKQRIIIDPTGNIGPIDKNVEVQKDEQLEATDVIIESDTVVE